MCVSSVDRMKVDTLKGSVILMEVLTTERVSSRLINVNHHKNRRRRRSYRAYQLETVDLPLSMTPLGLSSAK